MALELWNAFGPTINNLATYAGVSPPAQASIVSGAPVGDGLWLEVVDTTSGDLQLDRFSTSLSTQNFYWVVIRAGRATHVPAVGDKAGFIRIGGGMDVWLESIAGEAGLYRLEVRMGPATVQSSSTYTSGQTLQIRIEHSLTDGMKVWVSTGATPTLEGSDPTTTNRPSGSYIDGYTSLGVAGMKRNLYGIGLSTGASTADRPGMRHEAHRHDPVSGTEKYSDYGSPAGCGNSLGDYTQWDDFAADGTDHDGDTTFNCGESAVRKQTSQLSNKTYAETFAFLGVRYFQWSRSNTAGKTIAHDALVTKAGGTDKAIALASPGTTHGITRANFFRATNAPGGAWSQAEMDAIEAGSQRTADAANLYVTALGIEGYSINNDTDAVWWDPRGVVFPRRSQAILAM